MPNYVFLFEYCPRDQNALAFYDHIGDSICIYLLEMVRFFTDQNLPDLESVLAPFIANVFAHEDLHDAITDVVDTSAYQEHDIMDKICDFLNTP